MPSNRFRKARVSLFRIDSMEITPNILEGELSRRHEFIEPPEDLGSIDLESAIVTFLVGTQGRPAGVDCPKPTRKFLCAVANE